MSESVELATKRSKCLQAVARVLDPDGIRRRSRSLGVGAFAAVVVVILAPLWLITWVGSVLSGSVV